MDQLIALEESIHLHVRQMNQCVAELNSLNYLAGVDVFIGARNENKIRNDVLIRQFESRITFHAGRALELALHLIYARGTDRIFGKEYLGVSKEQIRSDRHSHDLAYVYQKICEDVDRDELLEAFEEVYQNALHQGVVDICTNDKVVLSLLASPDTPFRIRNISRLLDGMELTLEHRKDNESLVFPDKSISNFSELPETTFEEFLFKADSVYYGRDIPNEQENTHRKGMRWEDYSWRDHEYGRSYVVIGTAFFSRLIQGIVNLSHQGWFWNEQLAKRQIDRRRYNIEQLITILWRQNFSKSPDLPDMCSIDEELQRLQKTPELQNAIAEGQLQRLHTKFNLP